VRCLASPLVPASATTLLEAIDFDALPDQVRDDIRLLGPHICDGFTARTELARRTGLHARAVKARLDRIRDALTVAAFEYVDELDPPARERLLAEADRLTTPRR
jgi:hypothetical protein